MTHRDHMAAAMLEVIFNSSENWGPCQHENQEWYWDDMKSAAEVAYRLADAMIKAAYTTEDEKDRK